MPGNCAHCDDLVSYVMKFAAPVSSTGGQLRKLTRDEAEAWLDKHVPHWREKGEQ